MGTPESQHEAVNELGAKYHNGWQSRGVNDGESPADVTSAARFGLTEQPALVALNDRTVPGAKIAPC